MPVLVPRNVRLKRMVETWANPGICITLQIAPPFNLFGNAAADAQGKEAAKRKDSNTT